MCQSVSALEAKIEDQKILLQTVSNDNRKDMILVNVIGLESARENAIAQYNANASNTYDQGRFLDDKLPNRLKSNSHTTCGE